MESEQEKRRWARASTLWDGGHRRIITPREVLIASQLHLWRESVNPITLCPALPRSGRPENYSSLLRGFASAMSVDGIVRSFAPSKCGLSMVQSILSAVDPVDALRGGFLLTACTVRTCLFVAMLLVLWAMIADSRNVNQILAASSIPTLRERFISYGARGVSSESPDAAKSQTTRNSWVRSLLDRIAAWNVAHGFFLHFYIVSVLSSVLWAIQLATRGRLFVAVVSRLDDTRLTAPSMSVNQIVLCWTLLAAQGLRRLFECMTLAKKSAQSKMWFGHYIFGLAYYITTGIAIWIEGSGASEQNKLLLAFSLARKLLTLVVLFLATLVTPGKSLRDASISAPSPKTILFLPVFLIASGIQYDCHCYLASLKKYSLPAHPAFERLICPHYTAECAVYLSLSILAAPRGMIVNRTIFSGFILTAVNLGVSAAISKDWYARRFGGDKVQGKWKMIPRLY